MYLRTQFKTPLSSRPLLLIHSFDRHAKESHQSCKAEKLEPKLEPMSSTRFAVLLHPLSFRNRSQSWSQSRIQPDKSSKRSAELLCPLSSLEADLRQAKYPGAVQILPRCHKFQGLSLPLELQQVPPANGNKEPGALRDAGQIYATVLGRRHEIPFDTAARCEAAGPSPGTRKTGRDVLRRILRTRQVPTNCYAHA